MEIQTCGKLYNIVWYQDIVCLVANSAAIIISPTFR